MSNANKAKLMEHVDSKHSKSTFEARQHPFMLIHWTCLVVDLTDGLAVQACFPSFSEA